MVCMGRACGGSVVLKIYTFSKAVLVISFHTATIGNLRGKGGEGTTGCCILQGFKHEWVGELIRDRVKDEKHVQMYYHGNIKCNAGMKILQLQTVERKAKDELHYNNR